MIENTNPSLPEDSLDSLEFVMAIEEAFDVRLSDAQGEALLREIKARIERGEFGDDDDLAALVRKAGPRSPRGQAGGAARPEDAI